MTAKICGSWAYGTPTSESDVDVVMQISEDDEAVMRRALDLPEWGTIRIGKLNIIVARTDQQYELWCRGIEDLKARAPVTRDEAIAHFDVLFERNKCEQSVNGADSKTEYEAALARLRASASTDPIDPDFWRKL